MENIDVISIYRYCCAENIDILSILIFANIAIPNKRSSFVASNEAEQLCRIKQAKWLSRPIRLNGGKYQRKAGRLLYPGNTWLACQ